MNKVTTIVCGATYKKLRGTGGANRSNFWKLAETLGNLRKLIDGEI